MQKQDPDVMKLEDWCHRNRLSLEQFNAVSKIVEKTVQHKLQEFAEAFMKMDVIDFRKEQSDMIKEKETKTGLFAE